MGVNKVVYSGKTLVDLTKATVTPAMLIQGVTAFNAAGELITGTMEYFVSTKLHNATLSSEVESVSPGASYTSTVKADSGYTLAAVTVKMGGADITSSAYKNGAISIPKVTGNIQIVASTEEAAYTNLVPASTVLGSTAIYNGTGYKDGYRISSGTGESAASGYVITGVMPYEAKSDGTFPAIYIKGCTLDTTNSNVRWTGINSNNAARYQVNGGASAAVNKFEAYFTIENLGTNYYKLTPISGSFDSIVAMKMSLKGSGADLIITTDEPIV